MKWRFRLYKEGGRYRQDKSVTYIYDISSKKLTEVASSTVDLLLPSGSGKIGLCAFTRMNLRIRCNVNGWTSCRLMFIQ